MCLTPDWIKLMRVEMFLYIFTLYKKGNLLSPCHAFYITSGHKTIIYEPENKNECFSKCRDMAGEG